MSRSIAFLLLATVLSLSSESLQAQNPTFDPLAQRPKLSPLNVPELSPGEIELMTLEGKFAESVAKGGGKAFASWFADDAVALSNGRAAKLGRSAIAADAKWNPKDYQLTWIPEGAKMGPSGDTGFTWGHYESTAKDQHGAVVKQEGRYITFWKKVKGEWKVAMDASANDAPAAGDCCALPKP